MDRIMNTRPPEKHLRWRKIPREKRYRAEDYLKEREKMCVAASARFIRLGRSRGHIWHLSEGEDDITALLIHHRRSLFPVFDNNSHVPRPRFLNRFLGKVPIHALQGLRQDTALLEGLMENQGYFASERIDFDLMSLDTPPKSDTLRPGPPNLLLRPPRACDTEDLFALQSAYEQEEVLPANAVFYPATTRMNLEHILTSEHILVAELEGQVVGKINTSAESFSRFQIGGVYVRPDRRGLGIGQRMTAVFATELLSLGKGLTLYVKKRNAAARAIYRRAGFTVLADYRITYF